jgi:hypothetical protein
MEFSGKEPPLAKPVRVNNATGDKSLPYRNTVNYSGIDIFYLPETVMLADAIMKVAYLRVSVLSLN